MSLVRDAAREVIEGHKSEGRKVVLATTTPHDVIVPFARRLGFDDVVATRYEVDTDGVEPLTSVVHAKLPLRDDVVTDGGDAARVLSNAPKSADGFFVVPKVVE